MAAFKILLLASSLFVGVQSSMKCEILEKILMKAQETEPICQACLFRCVLGEKGWVDEEGFPKVDEVIDFLYPEDLFPESRPTMKQIANTCISRVKKTLSPDDMCDGYAHLLSCLELTSPKLCPGNEPCLNPSMQLTQDDVDIMNQCNQCGSKCVMEFQGWMDEEGKFGQNLPRMIRGMMRSCTGDTETIDDKCVVAENMMQCMISKYESDCAI